MPLLFHRKCVPLHLKRHNGVLYHTRGLHLSSETEQLSTYKNTSFWGYCDQIVTKIKIKNCQIADNQRTWQFALGARTDSNRRHSEPQAITRIFSKPLCTSLFPRTEKTVFAAILRLFVFRAEICKVVPFLDFMFFNYDL